MRGVCRGSRVVDRFACRTHGACAIAVVVTLAVWLSGATAALASSWSVKRLPSPIRAKSGVLSGVSCRSATACTAVGFANRLGRDVTLAERWNGSRWAIEATPNPAGANGSRLVYVSCVSRSFCTAVGTYFDRAGVLVTLAERWNNTGWAIQATPNPAAAKRSKLNGVSCSAATACVAVGWFVNGSGKYTTLAERSNGTGWAIQPTPNPAGAKGSELIQTSCTSLRACTAVGDFVNSAGTDVTLAERWNGAGWTIESTPNPVGAQSSDLAGVSCTRSTTCTAVGYYVNSAGTLVSLAERWNGSTWSNQQVPTPAGAKRSALVDVSCTSIRTCTAVGDFVNSAGTDVTLAERWNGHTWAIQPTPNPRGAKRSVFYGASCGSTAACTAVGWFRGGIGTAKPLAERYS